MLLVVAMIGAIVVVLRLDDDTGPQSIVVSPLGLRAGQSERLYPENDPWEAYLAPESICPGGEDRSAPIADQLTTMVCLLNWARERRGLPALPVNGTLSAAARAKAEDIYRCSDFAHKACGKEAHSVAQEAGYGGSSWGENLYAGSDELGRPRVAVDGWLNSAGHRQNLFREAWSEQGIALLQTPSFKGVPEVALWVSHFGRP